MEVKKFNIHASIPPPSIFVPIPIGVDNTDE